MQGVYCQAEKGLQLPVLRSKGNTYIRPGSRSHLPKVIGMQSSQALRRPDGRLMGSSYRTGGGVMHR